MSRPLMVVVSGEAWMLHEVPVLRTAQQAVAEAPPARREQVGPRPESLVAPEGQKLVGAYARRLAALQGGVSDG